MHQRRGMRDPKLCHSQFARLYPLSQGDLEAEPKYVDLMPLAPSRMVVENPSRDYCPPQFVNLLFTDLGVLTPAAVSDELIQLCVPLLCTSAPPRMSNADVGSLHTNVGVGPLVWESVFAA